MEMAQTFLTLQHQNQVARVDATRIRFSAHQCFARDGGADDLRCLKALEKYLARQPGLGICVDGAGHFLQYFLDQVPSLRQHIQCLIVEEEPEQGSAWGGLPVVTPEQIPAQVKTVFLCETLTCPRLRMKKCLPAHLKIVEADVLAELAKHELPARAWTPWARDTIYPIDVPEIQFQPGMDLILIDCPARNLGLMPNGLGYVHNALKHVDVKYQTLDVDIILYHRFHIRRLFDEGGKRHLPSGRELPTDPWQAEHYDLWTVDEAVSLFAAEIEEIVSKLVAARPKILGLSVHGCNERISTEVVKRVKAALPEVIVLVGGFSCYSPEIGLRGFPLADYMCIGEADLTVGPLVERLARGERPANTPGVLCRFDQPGLPFIPAPMVHDLDLLEHPRYEWFKLDVYRNYNGYQLTPVIASRGCRWSRCTFCAERFYWRIRSPKNFVDELEWLVEQGCRLFMFNESDLNGQPEVVLGICDEVLRRGLKVKLTGQLRIHKKSDQAFFRKLRQAGFVVLRFGVDAFSDNALRLQKKGYTKATISQNLRDCWEAGIGTEVNWVIGVPGETEADIDEGIDLILHNKPYIGRLANINPLILATGSVYWLQPEEHNIHFRENQEELYHKQPRAMPAHLWYSTAPYIDEKVRKRWFEKIVLALHQKNFDVGAWAARVIEDVQKNRDPNRVGLSDDPNTKYINESGFWEGEGGPGREKAKTNQESTLEFNADARSSTYVFRAGSSLPEDKVHYFRSYIYLVKWRGELYGIEPRDLEGQFGQEHLLPVAKHRGCIDLGGKFQAHFARTKAAVPELLQSVGHYNIVYYDGLYYGLPQNPDWDLAQLRARIIQGNRLTYACQRFSQEWQKGTWASWLRRNISRLASRSWSRAVVTLKKVLRRAMASAGVPLQDAGKTPVQVQWGEDDIANFPGVVTSKNIVETIAQVEKIIGISRPSTVHTPKKPGETCDSRGPVLSLQTIEVPPVPAKSVPRKVNTLEGYNIMEYEGWFYGIPQALGEIHLDKVDVIENPDIMRDVSQEVVENEIREVIRERRAA